MVVVEETGGGGIEELSGCHFGLWWRGFVCGDIYTLSSIPWYFCFTKMLKNYELNMYLLILNKMSVK